MTVSPASRAAGLVLLVAGTRDMPQAIVLFTGATADAGYGEMWWISFLLLVGAALQTLAGWLLASGARLTPIALGLVLVKFIPVFLMDRELGLSWLGGALETIGPLGLALALLATRGLERRTSMRGELGALLVVLGGMSIVSQVWSLWELGRFLNHDDVHVGALYVAYEVGVAIVYVAIALVNIDAGRALARGEARARQRIRLALVIAIAAAVINGLLTTISMLYTFPDDMPVGRLILQRVLFSGAALIVPLALNALVAAEVDAEPADVIADRTEIPTVFVWAALWAVPFLLARAAVLALADNATGTIEWGRHADAVRWAALALAVVLLMLAVTVQTRKPVAIWFARAVALIGVLLGVALVYVLEDVELLRWRAVPIGPIATMMVGGAVLAHRLARSGTDVPSARVVSD